MTGLCHNPVAGHCSVPAAAALLYSLIAIHDAHAGQKQRKVGQTRDMQGLCISTILMSPGINMCGVGMAEGLGASIESLVGQSHLRDLLIQCCQVSIF